MVKIWCFARRRKLIPDDSRDCHRSPGFSFPNGRAVLRSRGAAVRWLRSTVGWGMRVEKTKGEVWEEASTRRDEMVRAMIDRGDSNSYIHAVVRCSDRLIADLRAGRVVNHRRGRPPSSSELRVRLFVETNLLAMPEYPTPGWRKWSRRTSAYPDTIEQGSVGCGTNSASNGGPRIMSRS